MFQMIGIRVHLQLRDTEQSSYRMIFFTLCPSESAARRPKLKLLPRSVKDPVLDKASTTHRESIFGKGKPRDQREFPDDVGPNQRTISESSH